MTIPTFEHIVDTDILEERGSYLALVEQLNDFEPGDVIEARDELAHEMARLPEIFLPRQFEDLAILYRNRCDRECWDWSNRIEDVTMFVSRTPDCSHIEEQYARIDTYSPMYKQWQMSTYGVKILRHEGPADLVTYDGNAVEVQRFDEQGGRWQFLADHERETVLVDFFFESLRATAMQLSRSRVAREAADADAKVKLETMLYGGPKRTTSIE